MTRHRWTLRAWRHSYAWAPPSTRGPRSAIAVGGSRTTRPQNGPAWQHRLPGRPPAITTGESPSRPQATSQTPPAPQKIALHVSWGHFPSKGFSSRPTTRTRGTHPARLSSTGRRQHEDRQAQTPDRRRAREYGSVASTATAADSSCTPRTHKPRCRVHYGDSPPKKAATTSLRVARKP